VSRGVGFQLLLAWKEACGAVTGGALPRSAPVHPQYQKPAHAGVPHPALSSPLDHHIPILSSVTAFVRIRILWFWRRQSPTFYHISWHHFSAFEHHRHLRRDPHPIQRSLHHRFLAPLSCSGPPPTYQGSFCRHAPLSPSRRRHRLPPTREQPLCFVLIRNTN
jgi:hypothetical protein